jgi:tRNA A37 threonylcarbamoyltransferase TsaD
MLRTALRCVVQYPRYEAVRCAALCCACGGLPSQHAVLRVCAIPTLARHLVVAGGVACNKHIRSALAGVAARSGLALVLPPPKWCTDNGAMVAWAGLER